MKILIDGDSCARKSTIIKIAQKKGIPVDIYCDVNHLIEDDYATVYIVDQGYNSADMRIANATCKNDIVITNDIGLATIVLARNGIPMNNYGTVFNKYNINKYLNQAYIHKTVRRKSKRNSVRTIRPKSSNKKSSFNTQLNKTIHRCQKIAQAQV